jgi:hypothetical protein
MDATNTVTGHLGLHWQQTGERRWSAYRHGRVYVIEHLLSDLFVAFDSAWPGRASGEFTQFPDALLAAQQLADEWDAQCPNLLEKRLYEAIGAMAMKLVRGQFSLATSGTVDNRVVNFYDFVLQEGWPASRFNPLVK